MRTGTGARVAGALVVALTLGATAAVAAPAGPAVNADREGVAIHGFDPVAYFVDGAPRRGTEAHESRWADAVWRFASDANRAAFEADPERYAPRYGGFCAWAVSRGERADVDPGRAWSIVDDKLYLNYSASIREKWEADAATRIEEADRRWPAMVAGDGEDAR